MGKFSFALGQMPEDADGRRPQALIVIDNQAGKEIAYLPYDVSAEVLISALALARSVNRDEK